MTGLTDRAFRAVNAVHRTLFTLSRGWVGGWIAGTPVVMLHTTGRNSGRERRTMLTPPAATSQRMVLIASKGGDDRHPAWFLNLRANPEVAVTSRGRRTPMRARILTGDERGRVWAETVAQYPRYAQYQSRTTRQIPVVVLEPAASPDAGHRVAVRHKAERRAVTAERVIPASRSQIFAILTEIDNHTRLDGSTMLQGKPKGPRPLTLGSQFTLAMTQRTVTYRSLNRVVEFEPDRRIAWSTLGEWNGRRVIGGQRWRYELLDHPAGTLVRHTYVWGYARAALLVAALTGFPRQMSRSMPRTLRNLERLAVDHPGDPRRPLT